MSMAAVSCLWLCRNERQVGEGALGRHGRYLPTVAWLTSMPSLSSSPWMRARPKAGLPGSSGGSDHRPRGSYWAVPGGVTAPPVASEAFAMPLDDGCRFDQHHGVEDLRPDSVKPRPEQPVGGEEPRPARALPAQDGHAPARHPDWSCRPCVQRSGVLQTSVLRV